MANHNSFEDAYTLMNAIAKQTLGIDANISVVDLSSFVSVGEKVLRTGYENVMNAISKVISTTIFSARPYSARFGFMEVSDAQTWGARIRKITPLRMEAEQDTAYNTTGATNLADGNSIDHYKQNIPKCVELNFYGSEILQRHITRFKDQIADAFTNPASFMSFFEAIMTEFANDIETDKENKSRATLLNYIGGLYEMNTPHTVVDLVAGFNSEYGLQLTRADLLSTHLEEFAKYVASTIKTYSKRLQDRGAWYHANIGSAKIMRHTPKEFQRMVMLAPVFEKIDTAVYSTLFHPDKLNIGEFAEVNYWQSPSDVSRVKVTPNILNTNTGASETATSTAEIPFVLGVLYDRDALGVRNQFEAVETTPMNAAGLYTNTYYHWRFQCYTDYTENGILFTLGAGGSAS